MTEVRILDLLANSSVGPAAHLDPKTVQKYAERRGDLPPVVVFETSDGLLLVDGYHRVAAAQRRAQSTIAAEILRGSRGESPQYAVMHAAAQRGLSTDEALRRIEDRSGVPRLPVNNEILLAQGAPR